MPSRELWPPVFWGLDPQVVAQPDGEVAAFAVFGADQWRRFRILAVQAQGLGERGLDSAGQTEHLGSREALQQTAELRLSQMLVSFKVQIRS